MTSKNQDGKTVAAMDSSGPGHWRDHRRKPERRGFHDKLKARMDELGMKECDYDPLSRTFVSMALPVMQALALALKDA